MHTLNQFLKGEKKIMNLNNIPQELKEKKIWTCFKVFDDPKPDNPHHKRKLPIEPVSGNYSKRDDPSTWSDFETCLNGMKYGLYQAIAFLAMDGVSVIDIDACIDESGNLSDVAKTLLSECDTYAEYSVSGKGIHIVGKAMPETNLTPNQHGTIELYGSNKTSPMWIIATGDVVDANHKTIKECQDFIDFVYEREKMFRLVSSPVKDQTRSFNYQRANMPVCESDEDVIQAIRRNSKYSDMWDGIYVIEDRSKCDLSLMTYIAILTDRDPTITWRIFQMSGLYSNRPDHFRNSYLNHTLDKACGITRE